MTNVFSLTNGCLAIFGQLEILYKLPTRQDEKVTYDVILYLNPSRGWMIKRKLLFDMLRNRFTVMGQYCLFLTVRFISFPYSTSSLLTGFVSYLVHDWHLILIVKGSDVNILFILNCECVVLRECTCMVDI